MTVNTNHVAPDLSGDGKTQITFMLDNVDLAEVTALVAERQRGVEGVRRVDRAEILREVVRAGLLATRTGQLGRIAPEHRPDGSA
jgi:hypothetical protein